MSQCEKEDKLLKAVDHFRSTDLIQPIKEHHSVTTHFNGTFSKNQIPNRSNPELEIQKQIERNR